MGGAGRWAQRCAFGGRERQRLFCASFGLALLVIRYQLSLGDSFLMLFIDCHASRSLYPDLWSGKSPVDSFLSIAVPLISVS